MKDRFACPCYRFLTLSDQPPGTHAICPVCWWEDDEVQYLDPEFSGGANTVSLREARDNFRSIGAAEPGLSGNVRGPTEADIPDFERDERPRA